MLRFSSLMGTKLLTKSHGLTNWKEAPDIISVCELSRAFTTLLADACRRHGTTVYGAVSAALLHSARLRAHCFEHCHASSDTQETKITTPIDLRRHGSLVPENAT